MSNLSLTKEELKDLARFLLYYRSFEDMDEESGYAGEVQVIHYLELLENEIGWDKIKAAVKKPLTGMRVGAYYGCTLLRPDEVALNPALLKDFLAALGAEVVDFSEEEACCGSYQILGNENAAYEASARILTSVNESKIDALAMSCPVCEYNLGRRQGDVRGEGIKEIPTFYFTQLLAVALGLPDEVLGLQYNMQASQDLLRDLRG